MATYKRVSAQVDTSSNLNATADDLLPDDTLYRILSGALHYLTFTRLDISYAVQQFCLFIHPPMNLNLILFEAYPSLPPRYTWLWYLDHPCLV